MPDDPLTPEQIALLGAIVGGKRAWGKVDVLVRRGHSESDMEALVSLGWLERWSMPASPALTLTPWGAERLKVMTWDRWVFVSTREKERPSDIVVDKLSKAAPHPVLKQSKANPDSPPGTPRMLQIQNAVEVPHWRAVEAPREPGDPKPKKIPVTLPKRHRESRLPYWIDLELMEIESDDDPVQDAIDGEEYLMAEVVGEDGRLAVDEATGVVKTERLMLLGQEIPRAKAERKKGKAKRNRGKGKKKKASDSGGTGGTSAPDGGTSGRPAA